MDYKRASASEATPLLRAAPEADPESSSSSQITVAANDDFGLDGDKDNPHEWPAAFKWAVVLLLACMSFTV
jgi:hypothetical protein